MHVRRNFILENRSWGGGGGNTRLSALVADSRYIFVFGEDTRNGILLIYSSSILQPSICTQSRSSLIDQIKLDIRSHDKLCTYRAAIISTVPAPVNPARDNFSKRNCSALLRTLFAQCLARQSSRQSRSLLSSAHALNSSAIYKIISASRVHVLDIFSDSELICH